jgi:hypothetical protein
MYPVVELPHYMHVILQRTDAPTTVTGGVHNDGQGGAP